ncbi:hypothetical protein [Petrotoga sp. 9PWA.NaAc.5.4]|uniref:hypothetical protein n=1 Tax=Petrotoga sp. 9PWA.NaAc.5.4 TaxID=1434328 RepID=UPI001304B515|nr:hypothetical protein [Petrotoga sp. 9PWA.NaAc.5.4]
MISSKTMYVSSSSQYSAQSFLHFSNNVLVLKAISPMIIYPSSQSSSFSYK